MKRPKVLGWHLSGGWVQLSNHQAISAGIEKTTWQPPFFLHMFFGFPLTQHSSATKAYEEKAKTWCHQMPKSWTGIMGKASSIPSWKSGWWFGTCFIFPYIGNNHPIWLSYFSERVAQPPILFGGYYRCIIPTSFIASAAWLAGKPSAGDFPQWFSQLDVYKSP